ncbi:hypothetical protein Q7C_2087 [Methylophaga frappieri]|uniref:Uncharacterized protein n=1 Tax=Methylophaga frappieri (strain ATCC BAA-2434 / DSM 25690 / JAM7) TaxID=754477 RepID=I1YJY3_METFJ|nr:hypothetical protein Q7C_2087 [Methylophaga frappieri]
MTANAWLDKRVVIQVGITLRLAVLGFGLCVFLCATGV